MRKPGFFVIGAPKCGTTTLCSYLSEHPEIYFSNPKEPHFFNDDFTDRYINNMKSYLSLFSDVDNDHIAVGEGSVLYLMSESAIPNILKFNPDALFIVMLRNPIEMASAWHSQAVYSFNEDEKDFSRAWALQEYRRKGERLPRGHVDKKIYLYGDVCKIGTQLKRAVSLIKNDRLLPIVFDDFIDNPQASYSRVLEFIGAKDRSINVARENPNKEFRSWRLEKLLRIGSRVKQEVGIQIPLGARHVINRFNTKITPRKPLPYEMKDVLREYYEGEIEILSELMGRDLTPWLKGMPIDKVSECLGERVNKLCG